jgi:hypothetical protein
MMKSGASRSFLLEAKGIPDFKTRPWFLKRGRRFHPFVQSAGRIQAKRLFGGLTLLARVFRFSLPSFLLANRFHDIGKGNAEGIGGLFLAIPSNE